MAAQLKSFQIHILSSNSKIASYFWTLECTFLVQVFNPLLFFFNLQIYAVDNGYITSEDFTETSVRVKKLGPRQLGKYTCRAQVIFFTLCLFTKWNNILGVWLILGLHCCVNCFKFYRQKLCFFFYPHLRIKSKISAYRRHLL